MNRTRTLQTVLFSLCLLPLTAPRVSAQDTAPPAPPQAASSPPASASTPDRLVIVVRGASGTPEYGRQFDTWSARWQTAAAQGQARCLVIGSPEDSTTGEASSADVAPPTDRRQLQSAIHHFGAAAASSPASELWLVLIGHGTYDGRTARFNLQGPDVGVDELATWLDSVPCPVAVLNCASSSGPFLERLSGRDRVVVTATRSGAEQNFARFGDYLSRSIGDPAFDLDKDGQTSLLEAFLSASRRVEQAYDTDGRLATEHALLDDNGDRLGVRADWFRGIRAVRQPPAGQQVDGLVAHQWHMVRSPSEQQLPRHIRAERDRLELAVIQLRDRRHTFASLDDYYRQLETLLIPLARLTLAEDGASAAPIPSIPAGAAPPASP